jgi:hypothetical protein
MASIKQYDGSWPATAKRKGHGVLVKHFPPRTSGAMGRGKHFPENMKERGANNKRTNKGITFIGIKMTNPSSAITVW